MRASTRTSWCARARCPRARGHLLGRAWQVYLAVFAIQVRCPDPWFLLGADSTGASAGGDGAEAAVAAAARNVQDILERSHGVLGFLHHLHHGTHSVQEKVAACKLLDVLFAQCADFLGQGDREWLDRVRARALTLALWHTRAQCATDSLRRRAHASGALFLRRAYADTPQA